MQSVLLSAARRRRSGCLATASFSPLKVSAVQDLIAVCRDSRAAPIMRSLGLTEAEWARRASRLVSRR